MKLWRKMKMALGAAPIMLLVGGTAITGLRADDFDKQPNKEGTGLNSLREDLSPTNILMEVRKAYALLSTYRDTSWTVHEYNGDSWTNRARILLGGRNCYRIEVETAPHPYSYTNRYWSEGLDNYFQQGLTTRAVCNGLELAGNVNLCSHDSLVPALFFNLMWGNVISDLNLPPTAELMRYPDETIGDADCYVLGRKQQLNGATNELHQLALWIGKEDFLVRRWRDVASFLQANVKPRIRTETHENIIVNEETPREDYVPIPVPTAGKKGNKVRNIEPAVAKQVR